jgi:alpha-tubulin suppressor-like RCC1 family protein
MRLIAHGRAIQAVAAMALMVGLISAFGFVQGAGANGAKPKIASVTATPTAIVDGDGWVTLEVHTSNATSCTFTSTPSIAGLPSSSSCASGVGTAVFDLPLNAKAKSKPYQFDVSATGAAGTKAATAGPVNVTVDPGAGGTPGPLAGVKSLTQGGAGFCAVVKSNGVDCWGAQTLEDYPQGSVDIPAVIPSTSGAGRLTGVDTVVSDRGGYCALMTSGGVDCWATGAAVNDTPVPVAGVGGAGILSDVTQLVADGNGAYCALLGSGEVACWGQDAYGELGNATWGAGSSTPVAVVGTDGTGTLGGVGSLAGGYYSFCAILSANGGLDCWGFDNQGEFGTGTPGAPESCTLGCSTIPLEVAGGGLTGVVRMASTGDGGTAGSWCALLDDSSVTCWGWDNGGGGSTVLPSPPEPGGPVSGITSLIGTPSEDGQYGSYCGITSGASVTCWRDGEEGELGNGATQNSATMGYGAGSTYFGPATVLGVKGEGALAGVAQITYGNYSYCARLSAGGVDCWGSSGSGQLGDAKTDGPDSCQGAPCATTPQKVGGVGGAEKLSGVAAIASDDNAAYCALLTNHQVDCWGDNTSGNLGDGTQTSSSSPVQVLSPLT